MSEAELPQDNDEVTLEDSDNLREITADNGEPLRRSARVKQPTMKFLGMLAVAE